VEVGYAEKLGLGAVASDWNAIAADYYCGCLNRGWGGRGRGSRGGGLYRKTGKT
jgi:hypothetical protein